MTDVTRKEFEALKDEVQQLKEQLSDSNPSSGTAGLDHRDEAVLERVRKEGDKGPMRTLRLYRTLTDISNKRTAKERAKNLRNHPEFKKVVA